MGWAPNRLRTAAGAFHALRELLEHESYDVVEYPECGGDGMMVSTMLSLRTCVRFHSPAALIMDSYGVGRDDYEATVFLEQIGIDRADVRTAPSGFMASAAVARLGVEPPVHVVPNGIDLDLFDADEGIDVVDRFGLPSGADRVTVLFTSRLERRKGAHLLADICSSVLRAHPRVHVVVAGADGGGLVESTIRPRLVGDRNGDRFHYLGHLPMPEVRSLVKHVDIHMLPTLWDNAPYTCLEAMAAGRAIVASDVGGMPELIEHERNGLLARTDDWRSFATAVSRLVDDASLRERLGAEARRVVEQRYTDVAVAESTTDLWRRSLDLGP